MPDLTTNQRRHLLAALEVECSSCNGTGYHDYLDDKPELPCERCTVSWMNDYKGTGRRFLLEGVRRDCLLPLNGVECYQRPNKHCSGCHGLGWTPTKDAWKWLEEGFFVAGFDSLWYAHPGPEGRDWPKRWHAGVWTGPDNDLLCTKHYSTSKEAEANLSPGGDTPMEALLAALLEACRPLAVNDPEAWVLENVV